MQYLNVFVLSALSVGNYVKIPGNEMEDQFSIFFTWVPTRPGHFYEFQVSVFPAS